MIDVFSIFFNIAVVQGIVHFMRLWLTAGMGPAGYILDNYVFFHGVMVHEISHMMAAVLTGAKIKDFNLFKVDPVTRTLGSVEVQLSNNFFLAHFQSFFISLAPLFMSCFICTILAKILLAPWYNGEVNFIQLINLPQFWVYVLIVTPILCHSDLSFQDIKVGFLGILLVAGILCIVNLVAPAAVQSILTAVIKFRNSTLILMIIPFILGLVAKFML